MTSDSLDPEVVRARRLEIVDGDGRLRAVLGDVGPPGEGGRDFGLALVDSDGQRRVWLSVGAQGPVLAFDSAGNSLVELGVHDESSDALHVGAYLVLSDRSGVMSIGWWVEDDGSVSMRTGSGT